MTETLHQPTPEAIYPTAVRGREEVLRDLLPYDYDYAKDAGLVDMFYYDAKTGEDGLLHTLAGNTRTGEGGFISEGYHHEESGETAWPKVVDEHGVARPTTRVDRSHLEDANSQERRKYREYPFEPYQGQVVINGLKKMSVHIDPETGARSIVPAKNTMFPQEYDALAVMQTARAAYENRDTATEQLTQDSNGDPVIVSVGYAPMMDGKSQMPVKLVMDAESLKIKSAIPVTKRKPGVMKLTPEQADELIYGDLRKPR